MKRPALVVVVNVLQVLLGLSLAGITIYLLILTRSRETLSDQDSKGVIHGLLIGALVLGIPAVITLIGAVGLGRGRFWGWVLSLATDIGMLGVLVYSMMDENDVDTEMLALAVGFAVPMILLVLPAVRKFFWTSSRSALVA